MNKIEKYIICILFVPTISNAAVTVTGSLQNKQISLDTGSLRTDLSTITIIGLDEGTPLTGGQLSAINCVGSGVNCAQSNGTMTVTVSGGGGGGGGGSALYLEPYQVSVSTLFFSPNDFNSVNGTNISTITVKNSSGSWIASQTFKSSTTFTGQVRSANLLNIGDNSYLYWGDLGTSALTKAAIVGNGANTILTFYINDIQAMILDNTTARFTRPLNLNLSWGITNSTGLQVGTVQFTDYMSTVSNSQSTQDALITKSINFLSTYTVRLDAIQIDTTSIKALINGDNLGSHVTTMSLSAPFGMITSSITVSSGTFWQLISTGIGDGGLITPSVTSYFLTNSKFAYFGAVPSQFSGGMISTTTVNLYSNTAAAGELSIAGDGVPAAVTLQSFGGSNVFLSGRSSNGTMASPTASAAGNVIMKFGGSGHTGATIKAGNTAQINFFATEDWTPTTNGTRVQILATPLGQTSNLECMTMNGSSITTSIPLVVNQNMSVFNGPATGGALCLNASNVLSKCTSLVDASGNCTCP